MEISITCQKALGIMHRILGITAEINAYKNWDDHFAREEINRIFTESAEISQFWIDVFNLSCEEKLLLGFKYFNENTKPKMLIPLWIIRCLPEDFFIPAMNIFDESVMISKNIQDQDARGGCTSYLI